MKKQNARLHNFCGKCPRVYNSGLQYKPSGVKLIKKAEAEAKAKKAEKPLKLKASKAPKGQEQKPLTVQFDINPDLFRKGKENTRKYHRVSKAPDFTRCVINGQVYFLFK